MEKLHFTKAPKGMDNSVWHNKLGIFLTSVSIDHLYSWLGTINGILAFQKSCKDQSLY